jgi:hypothetical protein
MSRVGGDIESRARSGGRKEEQRSTESAETTQEAQEHATQTFLLLDP